MPSPSQVTKDGDQFLNTENEIAEGISKIKTKLIPSAIINCVRCGEPIPSERKSLLPSATTCIDCAE